MFKIGGTGKKLIVCFFIPHKKDYNRLKPRALAREAGPHTRCVLAGLGLAICLALAQHVGARARIGGCVLAVDPVLELVVLEPQLVEVVQGLRVRRPFGARGMSSVRYRTRLSVDCLFLRSLGDLKNKHRREGRSDGSKIMFS